jgi:leucyl/phenylalanyl-tRNA---protein transferase
MTKELEHSPLSVEFLLLAYSSGYFPMADPQTGVISWYSPDPRAVIPIDTYSPSRALRRTIRRGLFRVTLNSAFHEIIGGCAAREDTWISAEIIEAYGRLHERGYAHSVEAWREDRLAGGLYGVALGGAFFGESMFSKVTEASKVAFAFLVHRLRQRGFILLDTQFINPHVLQFGATEIPRARYLEILRQALEFPASLNGGEELSIP